MIGQFTADPPGNEIGWVLVAVCALMLGVLAGLIGLVSMAIRRSRAPIAGALVTICGVVIIISMVAFGIETGDILPGGLPVLGGLFIAIGLCMAFLGNPHSRHRAATPRHVRRRHAPGPSLRPASRARGFASVRGLDPAPPVK